MIRKWSMTARNPWPWCSDRSHACRRHASAGRDGRRIPALRHFQPRGRLMVRDPPGHVAGSPKAHLNQAESTNWSGYAVTRRQRGFPQHLRQLG